MIDYSRTVLLALKAAIKAKDEILKVYENTVDVEIKNDGTPITIADKNSNNAIVSILEESSIPIISEESRLLEYDDRKDAEFLWLIDPLDGTKEFIKKNGEFTINIGFVRNTEPEIGITAVPVTGAIYIGWVGQGAYKVIIDNDFEKHLANDDIDNILKNSTKLSVAKETSHIDIAVSRSHPGDITGKVLDLLSKEGVTASIIKMGSALKFGLIAEGSANVYVRGSYSYEWDTASGHALVNAAGGKVLSVVDGKPVKYNKPQLKNQGFVAVASDKILKLISGKLTF